MKAAAENPPSENYTFKRQLKDWFQPPTKLAKSMVHNFFILRIEVLFKEMIVMWMCRQATIKTKPVRRVQSDMFTNQGVKAISTFYHPTTQKVFVRVETVTITLTEL